MVSFRMTTNAAATSRPISLPVPGGESIGLQLIGRPWDEGNLLNHGAVLEKAAGFVAKPDRWW